jgi:predicted ATPase
MTYFATGRVVITGGPGGGKTTLLRELGCRGFATVADTPRAIIRSRRALGLSPRPSPLDFAEQVLRRDVELYEENPGQSLTFFDRGVIDALAMVAEAAPERRAELVALATAYPYHPVVFVLPPWEEIYVNDDERDHEFAHAVRVSESLVAWYQSCGYHVAAVPKLPVAERCDYVLSALDAHNA